MEPLDSLGMGPIIRTAKRLEGWSFQPHLLASRDLALEKLLNKTWRASGLVNRGRCWEDGVPGEVMAAAWPAPPYLTLDLSSISLFLSYSLQNKPVIVRKVFPRGP